MREKLRELWYKFGERGQKCSFWFDGWFGLDWSSCCEEHDKDYEKQDKTKKEVDCKFYNCLKKKAGKLMAWIMLKGVSGKKGQRYWDGYKESKDEQKQY